MNIHGSTLNKLSETKRSIWPWNDLEMTFNALENVQLYFRSHFGHELDWIMKMLNEHVEENHLE